MLYAENSYAQVVLGTIGDDFEFKNAESIYNTMDVNIQILRMNNGKPGSAFQNVTIQYSTVKEYMEFQAQKAKKMGLESKKAVSSTH